MDFMTFNQCLCHKNQMCPFEFKLDEFIDFIPLDDENFLMR